MLEALPENGSTANPHADGARPPARFDFEEGTPDFDLMEYVALIWRRRWVVAGILVAAMVAAGAHSFTQPKRYRSTITIAIDSTPQIASNPVFGNNWWEMERFILNQVQVLKTEELARRVVARLDLQNHSEYGGQHAALVLANRIEVNQVLETDIIKISLTGLDPDHVSELLNVFVDEYIAANIDAALKRSHQVLDVIHNRLDPLRERLLLSEQEMMAFRESDEALLFADQDKNVITEQVNTLTSEYAMAKAERIKLETNINALNRVRRSSLNGAGFPEVLEDTTIRSISQRKNELEVELTEKLRTYKEGHPVIKDLRSHISGLQRQISEQLDSILAAGRTDYEIAKRREDSLYANIQQLKQQSIELSKQTMKYDRLKREYEQNKAFLEEMLARSKEVGDLSQDNLMNNVRVVDPARPALAPYSPNIQRSISVAMLLGLLLGVGLVLGLDFLDQTLRTPEQVERYLGLEVLSALPTFSEDKARVLRESFQALRTALMMAARGDNCQILLVTSAAPAEGKTTVAFNLAKVLATGGARVLLIDADLRKPRLHRLLKTSNTHGPTSVVLGEIELSDVLHATSDLPSLDCITTGPLPPNPPELYGKETFRRMLIKAREQYDWVIIDTPPVASVTDPVICARLVDMAMIVVEYAKTKRQVVQEAVRQLQRTGVRLAGTLLNKVDVQNDKYYYSYYSYYNYHYGEDEVGKEPVKVGRVRTTSASKG